MDGLTFKCFEDISMINQRYYKTCLLQYFYYCWLPQLISESKLYIWRAYKVKWTGIWSWLVVVWHFSPSCIYSFIPCCSLHHITINKKRKIIKFTFLWIPLKKKKKQFSVYLCVTFFFSKLWPSLKACKLFLLAMLAVGTNSIILLLK